jgi:hypothetical protein
LRVATAEGEGSRHQGPKPLNDGAWEFDDLSLSIHPAAVPGKDVARFFIPHQQADILEDFERGLVDAFDLFRCEEGGKCYQWITS